MKKCELCNSAASMYCGSDRALLCWDCDTKIHAANFLVAKHVRTLLCHACQSPTPWTGSGPKFGPTVSVCETCFHSTNRSYRTRGEEEAEDELETDTKEDEEEDDDGNDQVVPCLCLSFRILPEELQNLPQVGQVTLTLANLENQSSRPLAEAQLKPIQIPVRTQLERG